jgi:apolipoprotein N-acyltransferase
MRTLYLGVEGAVRLCAAFLSGALFGMATSFPDSVFRPLLGITGGALLWVLTLAATRRVTMPWFFQALTMLAGAATYWLILLVLAASSMD